MARSAEDYGIQDLSDETLQALAGDPRRYGEKSRYAGRELAGRKGVYSDANAYRAALEKSAYGDFGRQYGAGLNDITNYLARSGPLYDSGAATALRAKLASSLYGQAQSRIGQSYAQYLAQLMNARRGYGYQRALANMQNQKRGGGFGSTLGSIAGGVGGAILGGPAGAVAGYNIGGSL